MNELPVVFLAFANDRNNPLKLLELEGEGIYRHLTPRANQQHLALHREPFATIEKISHYLTVFKDRVILFHFAGHANSFQLKLEDQNAHSIGIAELLATQKNLKLVFLNGCSTERQVEALLSLGIPAVIATKVPVSDENASTFAIQFYKALAEEHSIDAAFSLASGSIKAKVGDAITFERILVDAEEEELVINPSEEKWVLYAKSPSILKWKLPSHQINKFIIRGASHRYNTSKVPVNERLTEVLFKTLAPFNSELEFYQFKLQKGEKVDIRLIRRSIMDSLPSPVGEQVRKLFAANLDSSNHKINTISKERLEQLILTYQTLVELVSFTLMAQLWDAKTLMKDFTIGKSCKKVLREYFSANSDEIKVFNFFNVITEVQKVMSENKVSHFISELDNLKEDISSDKSFTDAFHFFEGMKKELYENSRKIDTSEVESFCVQAEIHLGNIFQKLGFCAKYKFATIKNIDIIKPRHKPARFRHYKVKLDTVTAGYLDVEEEFTHFTDDNSVLLFKSNDTVEEYLSLSPFIVDENALKGEQKSKLFLFSHCGGNGLNNYWFKFPFAKNDYLEISDQHYVEIKEQFQSFRTTLGI